MHISKFIVGAALILWSPSAISQTKHSIPQAAVNPVVAEEKAKAAKGDTAAMYHMASRYLAGIDVKKDQKQAEQWLLKAAAKGHTDAMLKLGILYGQGVAGAKPDYLKSITWVRKAADKGNVRALNELAQMYEEGIGTKESKPEAAKYFRIAADKGYSEAMLNLAFCYMDGEGVKQDKQEGLMWLNKAASAKHPLAMRYIGDFYADPEMGNDCNTAIDWYMRASDAGDTAALNEAGEVALDGKCKLAGMDKLMDWIREACDKGTGDACYFIGRFYAEGKGVDQSYSKAMDFFTKDAEAKLAKGIVRSKSLKNLFVLYNTEKLSATRQQRLLDWLTGVADKTSNSEVMAGLGFIYTNKENATKKDYLTALDWSRKAADKGSATGMYNLGYLYANGLGVANDDKAAFEWMLKAASKGDKAAMTVLSEFYKNGQGTLRSPAKAAEWKKKAEEQPEKED